MDLPTQDVSDGYFSSEDEHSEEAWGRLFPLGESFLALGKDYIYITSSEIVSCMLYIYTMFVEASEASSCTSARLIFF